VRQTYFVRLHDRLFALNGWRRYGAAALLGAIATLALPPVHAIPLLLIAFPGLIWLLGASRSGRAAFLIGWWFGLGHFATGLYWFAHAMLVDPWKFGWMIPFAVFGVGGALGVYTGLVTLATHYARVTGWRRIVLFAALWTASEWLRGQLLTGFPWNLTGTAWVGVDAVTQLAAVAAVYGVSFLTVLVAAMPAVLAERATWRPVIAAFAVLAVVWVGGAIRLWQAEESGAGPLLRIVQPNIPQTLKWIPAEREAQVVKAINLTREGASGRAAAVIWPESSVPYFLSNSPELVAALARVAPDNGILITGAPRATPQGVQPMQAWNSLYAIDRSGIVGIYDKHHLVPFGEYVPARRYLPVEKITPGAFDFGAGPGPRTITFGNLPPTSPLICYEAIFPEEVVEPGTRPRWLLNITNDGWFGISSGPYQHFASARLRAVEQGLPLVRAANTGISAMVDSYGRVVARLGLDLAGAFEADLPPMVAPTPYARFGDWSVAVLLAAALALALWPIKRGGT
jgi:apolipoprotein N-acyltransferase